MCFMLCLMFRCRSCVPLLALQVMVMRGKDKGETGVVKRVIRSQNRVIVEGKNLVKFTSLHYPIRQISVFIP